MTFGCEDGSEQAAIAASKKKLENLVAPESVFYKNITIAKSLEGLNYQVDYDKVSEVLVRKAPKPEDYPKMPTSQFKLLVAQAEKQFVKSIEKKVEALNTELAQGKYKNTLGVCLEFDTNNGAFDKALCLYAEGDEEADCINIKPGAEMNSLFNIDITTVCK